jgi:hypothetical protein
MNGRFLFSGNLHFHVKPNRGEEDRFKLEINDNTHISYPGNPNEKNSIP